MRKNVNLLSDFIRVIGESSCISNYLKEYLTNPSDVLKNAPRLLQMLGGEVSLAKRKLTSAILFGWVSSIHSRGRNCAYIQPNTTAVYIHTSLPFLRGVFDCHYQLNKDLDFPGGLVPCMNKLFEIHHSIHGSLYGTTPNQQIITEVESMNDVDLFIFDENDPTQFQIKVLVAHGLNVGFRGGREHAYHRADYLYEGTFEVGHNLMVCLSCAWQICQTRHSNSP